MNKAIFMDRDGVINKDYGYVSKIESFEFLIGTIDALKKLNKEYLLFIITNQSGIARGFYTEEDFQKLNNYMLNELKKENITIERVKYCPHHEKGIIKKYAIICKCRKPEAKMILDLIEEYKIDVNNSYIIGDKESDIKAGDKTNLKTVLIGNKYKQKIEANYNFDNLLEFATWLLSDKKSL